MLPGSRAATVDTSKRCVKQLKTSKTRVRGYRVVQLVLGGRANIFVLYMSLKNLRSTSNDFILVTTFACTVTG